MLESLAVKIEVAGINLDDSVQKVIAHYKKKISNLECYDKREAKKIKDGAYLFQKKYLANCNEAIFRDRTKRVIIIYLLINFDKNFDRCNFMTKLTEEYKEEYESYFRLFQAATEKDEKEFYKSFYEDYKKIYDMINEKSQELTKKLQECIIDIINNDYKDLKSKIKDKSDGKCILFINYNESCEIYLYLRDKVLRWIEDKK